MGCMYSSTAYKVTTSSVYAAVSLAVPAGCRALLQGGRLFDASAGCQSLAHGVLSERAASLKLKAGSRQGAGRLMPSGPPARGHSGWSRLAAKPHTAAPTPDGWTRMTRRRPTRAAIMMAVSPVPALMVTGLPVHSRLGYLTLALACRHKPGSTTTYTCISGTKPPQFFRVEPQTFGHSSATPTRLE